MKRSSVLSFWAILGTVGQPRRQRISLAIQLRPRGSLARSQMWTSEAGGRSSGRVGRCRYCGLSVNDDIADSGGYLMGHRFCDASLGRFLSRDPIGFAGGLNLYSMAANNPVTFVDADGLHPAVLVLGGGEAAAATTAAIGSVAYPLVAAGAAYLTAKAFEGAQSLPSVERAAQFLPHHAGGPMTDLRYQNRPWDDASIHKNLNIAAKRQPNIEIKNGVPCQSGGLKQGPLEVTPRISRPKGRPPKRERAANILAPDGSYLDISESRVKAGIPNNNPKAPPGIIQKVDWDNPIPTSKGYKRPPNAQELDFLNKQHP